MIVIHIGLAKAGSSRLQTVLSHLELELMKQDIHYTRIGREGIAHHPLGRPLTSSSRSVEEAWAELRDFATPDRTVVISSESFETVDPRSVRQHLGNREARIVAYMRPATVRVPSLYSQDTKFGFNRDDFDVFFQKLEPDKRTRWLPSSLARDWASVFGRENVRVRALDSRVLTGGTLETDFLEFVGADGSLGATVEHDDYDNVSPGWKTLESVREIYRVAFVGRNARDIRNARDCWAFAQTVLHCATAAAEELDWTDRGRYLSLDQQNLLVDVHNREVELLSQLRVDSNVPKIRIDPRQVRRFLPTAQVIRRAERRKFIDLVAPRLLEELMSRASSAS